MSSLSSSVFLVGTIGAFVLSWVPSTIRFLTPVVELDTTAVAKEVVQHLQSDRLCVTDTLESCPVVECPTIPSGYTFGLVTLLIAISGWAVAGCCVAKQILGNTRGIVVGVNPQAKGKGNRGILAIGK